MSHAHVTGPKRKRHSDWDQDGEPLRKVRRLHWELAIDTKDLVIPDSQNNDPSPSQHVWDSWSGGQLICHVFYIPDLRLLQPTTDHVTKISKNSCIITTSTSFEDFMILASDRSRDQYIELRCFVVVDDQQVSFSIAHEALRYQGMTWDWLQTNSHSTENIEQRVKFIVIRYNDLQGIQSSNIEGYQIRNRCIQISASLGNAEAEVPPK